MRKITMLFFWAVLVAIGLWLAGCGMHGQGETAAEGRIRHKRILETSTQQMADDLDSVFLYDQPSKLSRLRTR